MSDSLGDITQRLTSLNIAVECRLAKIGRSSIKISLHIVGFLQLKVSSIKICVPSKVIFHRESYYSTGDCFLSKV